MALLDVLTVPHPILKKKAKPVSKVDDALRAQLDDMLETMYHAKGIGLAANQVGFLNRVVVMDVEQDENGPGTPIFLINPEIIWESEEISVLEEGCLSVPEQYGDVERPNKIKVRFLDYDGNEQEMEAEDLAAHCVQHEIDHLNGRLFIDYLSSLKRNMMVRKVKKITRDKA